MCGLCGIVNLDEAAPPVRLGELRAMSGALASRGPDGAGEWSDPERSIALGHRRLAILDLSEAASQPMRSPDGRYVMVYNGEIYNFRDLRARLEAEGVAFRSSGDTEVLLAGYARWGKDVLQRLRGMYAFAVWDTRERVLFAARDPFGIKPLYYSVHGGILRFASEARALLEAGAVPRSPDPAGVVGFLLWGAVPEPLTPWRELRQLPAGSWILAQRGRGVTGPVRFESFLAMPARLAPPADPSDRAGAYIAAAIEDSVRAHLVADVPVGVFLSSGLDSSMVAYVAACELGSRLTTVTVTFEGFRGGAWDEGPGAREVASRIGSHHVEYPVNGGALWQLWDAFLDAMDLPSIDGFNSYVVSRAAAQLGLKVALSGTGGDELFGGYPSFRDVVAWTRLARLARCLPGAVELAGVLAAAGAVPPKAPGLVRYGRTLEGAYFVRRGLYLPEELDRVLDPQLVREGLEEYQPLEDAHKCLGDVAGDGWLAVHRMETQLYLRNQLLRDLDRASMAHSLEVRVPLVDLWLYRRVAEAGFEPARTQGKAAVARAVAGEALAPVLQRPKSGFMVPQVALARGLAGVGRLRRYGGGSRLLAMEVLRRRCPELDGAFSEPRSAVSGDRVGPPGAGVCTGTRRGAAPRG